MKKINVLFVMLQMQMGGTERLIYNLVRHIDRELFNPSVAWFFGQEILREFHELDVPLFFVPKTKRLDFSCMQRLREIIREHHIDIVNAHHFMPFIYSWYGCNIKNQKPLVYTEHSERDLEQVSGKWKRLAPWIVRRADALIGVSPAVSERIRKTFSTADAKTLVIQNGIDLELIEGTHPDAALKENLGIAPEDTVLGIVANLRRVKNHVFLLDAFAEVIAIHPQAKLVIIGQGFENDPENSEPEVRALIGKKRLGNNVLLLGQRSDVPELLKIMDIFCLVSYTEGLPISLIEAMAAGLPVVGTSVPGIRELVVPGENGVLVQTRATRQLRDALLMLIQNASLRNRYGAASKLLSSEYSLNRCIRKYQDLFLTLTGYESTDIPVATAEI